MVNLWQETQRAFHKVNLERVIVVPHVAYYVLVAVQFHYQIAAGVVACIMIAEVWLHKDKDHENSSH